jgi:endogenous inhibitor of DNA gyrase (YacG/DUF329 family)
MPENGNGHARKIGVDGACPTCGKPAVTEYRPFCSRRCADVDLHRWLSGAYAIPGKEDEDEDGDAAVLPASRDKKEDEN